MGDTYIGECKKCGLETDLIMGVCQDCSLNEEWDTSKGFVCEQHPDKEFPHDDCSGPGIPDYKGILRARGKPIDIAQSEEDEPDNNLNSYEHEEHCGDS